jgi:hypothetical protein
MTMTRVSYQSAQQAGRDGFWQLLRSEWTKFRTVRGWTIALLAVAALTAVGPILLAGTATSNDAVTCVNGTCEAEGQAVATGPAGSAVIDNFYFVHQPLSSNGSITVAVSALHGSGSQSPVLGPGGKQPALPATEPWAKAGIMIKASTRPGSAYAAVMVTGSHGVRMQYDYSHDLAGPATAAAAQWLRLTRSGDTITGQESADGTHWTTIGSARLTGLRATAQAGMFVASPVYTVALGTGDDTYQTTTRATASFAHLSLQGGSAGQAWKGSAIAPEAPAGAFGSPGGPPPGQAVCQQKCPGAGQLRQGFTTGAGRYEVSGSGDIAPFVPIVDPMHVVFMATLFGLITVIGLGTVFVTAEYRRSLIRTTLTASPRRGRILLAKSIVIGTVASIAALIGAAIAFPVVVHKLVANGWTAPVWPELSLTSGPGLQIVLGTAAIAAAAAILGLAAGTIFRRSAAAVMAVLGFLVVPLILAIVLPLSVGVWLLRLTPAAAFSLQGAVPHYSQVSYVCAPYHACFPLDPWPGYGVLALWAAAALAGAIYLLRRRDA